MLQDTWLLLIKTPYDFAASNGPDGNPVRKKPRLIVAARSTTSRIANLEAIVWKLIGTITVSTSRLSVTSGATRETSSEI